MQARSAISAVPGVLLLLLLTGCSDTQAGPSSIAPSPQTTPPSTPPPTSSQPALVTQPPPDADAATYREGNNYYFRTPSKSFVCGILETPLFEPPTVRAGCQGPTTPVPADQRSCWKKWGPYGIGVGETTARYLCLNQGIFYQSEQVLPYGSSITAYGYTCTSREDGVTCRNDSTRRGFHIALKANQIF